MDRWYATILVVLLCFLPASGRAQETEADVEARNLFVAGQNAFGNGFYARAVDFFERAYALSHRSGLLYNIAFAADRDRSDARALEAYRAYLAAEPETERRAEVEARIAFLEAAQAPPPEPEPFAEAPEVEIAADAPQSDSGGGFHPAGIATLVGGGVLLASFGVFATLSELEDQRLASSCGRDRDATCAASSVLTLETLNTVADVSWIAGAAVAVTGLVLLLALDAEEPSRPSVALAPWFLPEGAGAVMVGQW